MLFVAVVALVIGFGESSDLAAAYGVAVTGTMLIDSLLLTVVMLLSWRWNRYITISLAAVFILVDTAFFTANSLKLFHGGWFPLAIGVVIFTLLTTWRAGRQLLIKKLHESAMPINLFLQDLPSMQRVPGTAIFLTRNPYGIPPALLHNLKHNKVVHKTIVLLTVRTLDRASIGESQRLRCNQLGAGFYRAELDFGYLEDQNVPANLVALAPLDLPLDPMQTSYFLSRETLLFSQKREMVRWREQLFSWMLRSAATPLKTFHLPPNRVVELGQQISL